MMAGKTCTMAFALDGANAPLRNPAVMAWKTP